jgi:hypothetical protein
LIPGYNHNVLHRGRTYHVQTEDNGPRNPVIITHLFVGGTILATRRSSYSDAVHMAGLENIVRGMMQEQHKSMLRSLISGSMDHLLEQEQEGMPPLDHSEMQSAVPEDAHSEHPTDRTPLRPMPEPPPPSQPPTPAMPRPIPTPAAAAPRGLSSLPPVPAGFGPGPAPAARVTPPPPPRRARSQPAAAPAPPQNADAAIAPVIMIGGNAAETEPTAPGRGAGARPRPASPRPDSGHRPEPVAAVAFGSDLISEKSLDEVILQYLSEEFTVGKK